MAVKDIKKIEEEKKEEKKVEEKKVSWFTKVPTIYKLLAGGLLFFKYQSIINTGANLQELWMWVIFIILGLYFIGTEGVRRETIILEPKDAEEALKKEIVRKIKEGQISRWAKIYVGPNNGLFHHEGMPQHYQIGVEIIDDSGRQYKRGIVFAEGNTKGYATLQDSSGKLTGRESIPIATPKIFKTLKKYDIDMDKFIFGEKAK